MHVYTRIRVRAKDIIVTNKKTDEERKAKKENKERKKTNVKAIDMAIRVTNPVNCRGKMARVNVKILPI